MRTAAILVVVAATLALAVPAVSAVVLWDVNGHWYEARLRPAGIDWETAEEECEADGGYLATITSQGENDFVFSLVSETPGFWYLDGYNNGMGPWLGGWQPTGSAEPAGGWRWNTPETWGFSNWAPGEPNNFQVNENRLHLHCQQCLIGSQWNDVNWDEPLLGYIFETQDDPTAVQNSSWTRIKALYKK